MPFLIKNDGQRLDFDRIVVHENGWVTGLTKTGPEFGDVERQDFPPSSFDHLDGQDKRSIQYEGERTNA